eukprot:764953-Hanusia_phi.AAC.4
MPCHARLVVDSAFRGMNAGEENGFRGYFLTFMIAYLRDFGIGYHFIAESFETSVSYLRFSPSSTARILSLRLIFGFSFLFSASAISFHARSLLLLPAYLSPADVLFFPYHHRLMRYTQVPWSNVLVLCEGVKRRIARACKVRGIQREPFVSCRVTQVCTLKKSRLRILSCPAVLLVLLNVQFPFPPPHPLPHPQV